MQTVGSAWGHGVGEAVAARALVLADELGLLPLATLDPSRSYSA
jgi:hypothetical protein